MTDTNTPALKNRAFWMRLLYMLFCAIAYGIAELVIGLLALFQIVAVAATGSVHERAQRLGRNASSYVFQLLQFVTFNDERVPFPFSDWPDETPGDTPWQGRGTSPAGEAGPATASATPATNPPENGAADAPGESQQAPDTDRS